MAKWGEGDRHWIAEERDDATNVNNWHWLAQVAATPPLSTGVKIPTCKLNLKETFLTSLEALYRVFVNQEMVQAFMHAAPTVDPKKGGRFHLLDGNII